MGRHIIWSNEYDTITKLEKDIKENPDDFIAEHNKGDDFWAIACQLNDEYLDDERENLKIEVGNGIIIIADLGLWYGRKSGYKLIHSTNIRDCLSGTCGDYVTWYVDELGDLRCDDTHHDGTNHYLYRAWKDGVSYAQQELLMQKIYCGIATRRDITRLTRKLGTYVADIYGWKIRNHK